MAARTKPSTPLGRRSKDGFKQQDYATQGRHKRGGQNNPTCIGRLVPLIKVSPLLPLAVYPPDSGPLKSVKTGKKFCVLNIGSSQNFPVLTDFYKRGRTSFGAFLRPRKVHIIARFLVLSYRYKKNH